MTEQQRPRHKRPPRRGSLRGLRGLRHLSELSTDELEDLRARLGEQLQLVYTELCRRPDFDRPGQGRAPWT